jgi:hypothetical protein
MLPTETAGWWLQHSPEPQVAENTTVGSALAAFAQLTHSMSGLHNGSRMDLQISGTVV